MTAIVTDPALSAPTSLARYDGGLLAVNSQFDRREGVPDLPFTVSSIPIPAAGVARAVPPATSSRGEREWFGGCLRKWHP